MLLILGALANRRDPLTAANAHRDQTHACLRPGQLIERFDRQDAAGGSNGVAQRDAAAVGVGAVLRPFEFPAASQAWAAQASLTSCSGAPLMPWT